MISRANIRAPNPATAWVDPAKGIGIVLVVVGHVTDGLVRAGVPFDADVFAVLHDTFYSFHMPLFFFLSGLFFLQSLEKRGLPTFIAGKVDSLLYPYVLWSLVQGFVEVAMGRYTNSGAQVSDVLALAWAPRQQMWFLYALFFVFVVSACARTWLGSRWIGVLGVLALLGYFGRHWLPAVPLVSYLALYLVFFVAGAWRRSEVRVPRQVGAGALAFAAVGFVLAEVLLQAPWLQELGGWSLLLSLVAAFAGIAFVVTVSRWVATGPSPILTVLGRHSMAIFVLHTLFASGARIVLQRFLHVEDVTVHVIAGIGLGILAPLVIGVLAERWRIGGLFEAPEALRLERRATRRPATQAID